MSVGLRAAIVLSAGLAVATVGGCVGWRPIGTPELERRLAFHPVHVQVTTLVHDVVRGRLVALDEGSLTLETDAGPLVLSWEKVRSVEVRTVDGLLVVEVIVGAGLLAVRDTVLSVRGWSEPLAAADPALARRALRLDDEASPADVWVAARGLVTAGLRFSPGGP